MTTTPDPKTVREIAREFLLDNDLGPDELDYVVRRHINYTFPEEEFQAWREAVDADAQEATVTKTASWPAEQPQDDGDVRAVADVMWLTQDDEGNFGVWRDPDNAREQIISDRFAEIRGAYEWVNDPDRTHEVLLRDDEMTGVTLWMACVADAALEARDAKPAARERVAELAEHAEEER